MPEVSESRERHLWTRYQLTLEDFDEILKSQTYSCAICGRKDPGSSGWNVDHDHKCCPGKITCGGCIRGLLCMNCNGHVLSVIEGKHYNAALKYLSDNSTDLTVYACTAWPTNAELIRDVAKLGHIKKEWKTLDPTYGNGVWWKLWRPDDLTTLNRNEDGSDFTNLSYPDKSFDVVVLDAPYVSIGGRQKSSIKTMLDNYGLIDAPRTPEGVQQLINAGVTEATRLARKRVLIKCMNYISSGKLWLGEFRTCQHADSLGLKIVDKFYHLARGKRPQPGGRRMVHARNNGSSLLVYETPR